MTTTLSILAVLGFVSALGAAWDRFGKRPRRRLGASDAEQRQANRTLDYYAKVWDSTEH